MKEILDKSQLLMAVMQLNDCKISEQVHEALFHLSNQLGFDRFLYSGRFILDGVRQLERIESNYPELWRQKYDKLGYARLDPTVQHAEISLRPLIWSDEMYVTSSQRAFQKEAYSHGLFSGVTFPVHSKDGDIALLSFSLSTPEREACRHVQEMLGWGSLIASLAHEAMRNIIKKEQELKLPKLTRRENEVLKWIAAGKSSWEISKVLNISEHGVIYHVRNLLFKFDVYSRHQAVVKAIALGII